MCRSSKYLPVRESPEEGPPTFGMVYHGRKHEGKSLILQVPMCLGRGWSGPKGFMDIHMSSLTHTCSITIFEAIRSNTFDSEGGITQFLMEDRKEANIDPLSGEEPVKIPFNRPRFQTGDFKFDAGDGENLSTARWNMVEKIFQSKGARLLTMEGN